MFIFVNVLRVMKPFDLTQIRLEVGKESKKGEKAFLCVSSLRRKRVAVYIFNAKEKVRYLDILSNSSEALKSYTSIFFLVNFKYFCRCFCAMNYSTHI